MLKIAKPFPYSVDGINAAHAAPGGDVSAIPMRLHAGLLKEGFLIESKEMGAAPENKGVPFSVNQVDVGHIEARTFAPEEMVQSTTFDPLTAPIESVRAYLAEHNARYHHKTGDAKLREMALEIVTK